MFGSAYPSFDLVLVDGPNLYNMVGAVISSLKPDPAVALEYMKTWLDFDRVVHATLGERGPRCEVKLGMVTFHSRKGLGRDPYRVVQNDADRFWGRQASAPNCSTMVVDIPKEQQETWEYACPSCQRTLQANVSGEKGIDTGMTTYLFETMHAWESLVLVTKDVDFVPPVLALRRRGKQVILSNDPRDAGATALRRSCQHFLPLDVEFIKADFYMFDFLRPGGHLDRLMVELGERVIAEFDENENTLRLTITINIPELTHIVADGNRSLTIQLLAGAHWPGNWGEFEEILERFCEAGGSAVRYEKRSPRERLLLVGDRFEHSNGLRRHRPEIQEQSQWLRRARDPGDPMGPIDEA